MQTFRLEWTEEVEHYAEVEAETEEQAEEMWIAGDIDTNEGDISFVEGSLEIFKIGESQDERC